MAEESGGEAEGDQQAPNMCTGSSGMMMMFMMMLLVMFMFSPIGNTAVEFANIVIYPVIGFDGRFPIWTIFIAGLFMIIFSTITRHFFTDWVETARNQRKMSAYNKELQKARKEGNESKAKKLEAMNPQIMKMQSDQMMNQMKPTMFTMFFALIVFRWLYTYIATVDYDYITMPWSFDGGTDLYQYPLNKMFLKGFICCGGGLFGFFGRSDGGGIPFWVGLYSLASVPIGQLLMRSLKLWEFKRRIKKLEVESIEEAESKITETDDLIADAKKQGANVQSAQSILGQAKAALKEENTDKTIEYTEQALEDLQKSLELHTRALEQIDTVSESVKSAKVKGMDVKSFNKQLREAKAALKAHDYDTVFSVSKDLQKDVRDAKKAFGNLGKEIQNTKSFLFDAQDYDDGRLKSMMKDVERAYKASDYNKANNGIREIRLAATKLQTQRQKAVKAIKKAEQELSKRGGSSDSTGATAEIRKAKDLLEQKKFDRAVAAAENAREKLL